MEYDASTLGRELARRLRCGETDASTVETAAQALEVLADLYDKSLEVLAKALDERGSLKVSQP